MQNLNLKTLKVIAICLTALMVICMAILLYRSPKRNPNTEIEIVDAINNREKIIHHSGDIYCYTTIPSTTGMEYALLKLPINFDNNSTREIIENYTGSLKNLNIDVHLNKVFYQNGATYYYDIIKKDIKKFCDGDLQFMLAPNFFVMLEGGNLYKGRYYPDNFVVNHFQTLAEGNFVNVGEDTKRVYYYSVGKTNSIVIGLDKETLNIVIYDNIETINQKLLDILVTDNYLFEIYGTDSEKHIRKIAKKRSKDGTYSIEELEIPPLEIIEFVDLKYVKPLLSDEQFDDIYFYGSLIIEKGDYYANQVLDTKLYKYDSKKNEVKAFGKLNELSIDRYSIVSGDDGCTLRFDGKDITKIPTTMTGFEDVNTMNVLDVNIIENYLYYDVQIAKTTGETEMILARSPRNGGESERINLLRKK